MKYQIISTVDAIGQKKWDALANSSEQVWGWFRALEEESLGMDPMHIAIYEKDELVAVMPAYKQTEDLYYDLNKRFFPYIHHLLKYTPFSLEPAIVCNSPGTFSSEILLKNKKDKRKMLKYLAGIADEICAKVNLDFFCIPYLERDKKVHEKLTGAGFKGIYFEAGTRIDLTQFKDYEDYLQYFSNNKKFKIQKELFSNMKDIKIDFKSDVEGHEKEMVKLYSTTFAKYVKGKKSFITKNLVSNLHKYLGEQMPLMYVYMGDELVSYIISFVHKGQMHMFKEGLNYKKTVKTNIYFAGYHKLAKYALKNGITEIDGGPSSYMCKIRRGYRIYKNYFYIRSPKWYKRLFINFVLSLNARRFSKPLQEVEDFQTRHIKNMSLRSKK